MPLNKNTQTKPEEEEVANEQAPEQPVADETDDKAPDDEGAAETKDGESGETAADETPVADKAPKATSGKGKKAVFMSVHRMMRDPENGTAYHTNRITEGHMPKKGSWLDCQMQADLIRKVKVG